MDQIQLYINGHLADLSDDTPVALTFQINNLAEVKNQQGNTSNQFKLPLTQSNRMLLGFPDEVAFTTNLPYTQYNVKVVQDGLEIIPSGIGELNSIDQDNANFTVLSGNVDFFDNIDGKLYDMGDTASQWSGYGNSLVWKDYNHQWLLPQIVSSQNNTEGWIWPVVDYGKIPLDFTGTPQIDVRYMRPGFFLHTAIDLLVKSAGYTAQGSLLSEPLYQKLIVQFANDSFTHGADYQNTDDNVSVSVNNQQQQIFNLSTVDHNLTGTVTFTNKIQPPSGTFHVFPSYFTAPINMKVIITFSYSLQIISKFKKHTGTIKFFIRSNPPGGGTYTDLATSEEYSADGKQDTFTNYDDKTLSFDTDLVPGQSILIAYVLNNQFAEVILKPGASLAITSKKDAVIYTQMVQCERIFPDISQKDLLKDTLQRFGIICQSNNTTRTVNFSSFRDIVNNIPRAKNWTSKCINQGKIINFQLGGYAQVNYMKYKDDENVVPVQSANSQINVKDNTLAASADLFESQFAPTLNRPWIGDSIAQINKVDAKSDSNDFSVSTQPRILIDQKLNLKQINHSVTFNDGGITTPVTVNDFLSVPYFDKPNGEYSLLFETLRLKYYPELEKILQRSKKIVRYFLLTPRDILELDLLIPVYLEQDNAYYYINKIDSWRKGQPCKVELVLLG